MSGADVIVVTALYEEMEAFKQVLDLDWRKLSDPRGLPYFSGAWDGRRVVLGFASGMGGTSTVQRINELLTAHPAPRLAMCGICAGNPDDVELGDVVVADRVYPYDAGKHTSDGFLPDIRTYSPNRAWLQHARLTNTAGAWQNGLPARPPTLRELGDRIILAMGEGERPKRKTMGIATATWQVVWARLAREGWVDSARSARAVLTAKGAERAEDLESDGLTEPEPPRVHFGPMASGASVRADGQIFATAKRHQRKLIAIEMEAAAVGEVASAVGCEFIVAKGVADFADGFKDDLFHAYAMESSARFLTAFLDEIVPAGSAAHRAGPVGVGAAPAATPPPTADPLVTVWTQDHHHAVLMAAIRRKLDRGLLLSWIDDTIGAMLPGQASYYAQIESDLTELVKMGRVGGTLLIAAWLRQAERLAGPFSEAKVFRAALDAVEAIGD